MSIIEMYRDMVCQFALRSDPYCQTFWQQVFTPDRVWGLAIALSATLFGAFTTFAVQTFLKLREEKRQLKERLLGFVMTTSRITADMQNIQGLLEYYRKTNKPEYELWQAAHTLQFTPGFTPDLSGLECLTRLRSSRLVIAAMHLYSEYASIIDIISSYNELRIKFTEERRNKTADEEAKSILWANMVSHLEFIEKTTALIIAEASEVQRLTYIKSEAALGSAAFLKLPDD